MPADTDVPPLGGKSGQTRVHTEASVPGLRTVHLSQCKLVVVKGGGDLRGREFVISGDVTMEQVRPLAEKYYGTLPATAVPVRARPDEPAQFAPRRVTKEDPRVQLASR